MKRNQFAFINVLSLLCLSPDATDGGVAASPEEDPLAADVSGIDTSMPRLQPGLYDVECTDVEVGPSKSNPNGETMKLTFKTTQEATDTQGNVINKGFPLFDYISLTPTEGGRDEKTGKVKSAYTLKDVAKKIATVAQTCGLTGITPRDIINAKGQQFKGKVIRIKVGIKAETAEFAESNTIKQYVPVQ